MHCDVLVAGLGACRCCSRFGRLANQHVRGWATWAVQKQHLKHEHAGCTTWGPAALDNDQLSDHCYRKIWNVAASTLDVDPDADLWYQI